MANVDYKAKIGNGTITVREAFDAVLEKKLTDSKKSNIKAVFKGLIAEGVDVDQPYFDVYGTREFAESLDFSTNKTGSHRFKEFNSFETEFAGLVKGSGRNVPYERLGDFQGQKGIASDQYGLFGKQLRAADPMRATIPSAALDKIYQDALVSPMQLETDTKRGIDKPVIIDREAADYLLYEKYTGQRAESNVGKDGLKISDFNIFEDENGQTVVEVRSKQIGNKTRPEATYTGEFAEFLKDKIRRAKEAAGPDADYTKVNLFQTTPGKVTALWDARIRPALEKEFSSALPAGKGGSHSVLRKILARQLRVEFKFPHDAVKSWMGHAGAGIDSSGDILTESYTGAVPDERIGEMTNVLVRNDAFNTKSTNVNSLFASRGMGFQTNTSFPTPDKKITAKTIDISQPQFTGQPMTAGELEEISAQASARAVEQEIATQKRRDYLSQIRSEATSTETPTTPVEPSDTFSESTWEKLKSRGLDRFFKTTMKVVGGAAAIETAYQAIEEPALLAAETAMEAGARALGLSGGFAAAVPMIVGAPSPGAGAGELRAEEAQQLELARQAGDIGLEKELMAREPITEVGGEDAPTISGQPVTRRPSAEEQAFGFIERQQAARQREEAASAAAEPMGFLAP